MIEAQHRSKDRSQLFEDVDMGFRDDPFICAYDDTNWLTFYMVRDCLEGALAGLEKGD